MNAWNRKDRFSLLGLCLIAAALAGVNFFHGFFEDSDVTMTIERAWEFAQNGYVPSRNWGYPLYELGIYPLIHRFGLTWAKAYSFGFYLLTAGLFFAWFRRLYGDSLKAFLASLCFLLHPLSIISGNSVGETSQGIFLGALAVYFLFRYFEAQKFSWLLLQGLFLGLATATRQDYLVLAASCFATLFIFRRVSFVHWIALIFLFLLTSLLPYALLYGPQHFANLATDFLQNDPLSRKLVRSVLGYLSILGLPVFFLLLFWSLRNLRRVREFPAWLFRHPAHFFLVCSLLFYFARYVALDTKQEYVSAILIPLLLFAAVALQRKRSLAFLAAAVFLPNLVQIHFFTRESRFIRPAFGFSHGVFVQERYERLKQDYIFRGGYYPTLIRIAKENFGCEKVFPHLTEPSDPDTCIIVPEERLRFWNPNRMHIRVDAEEAFKRKIIVFPLPDHRGWRQFMRFRAWEPLEPGMFRLFAETPSDS